VSLITGTRVGRRATEFMSCRALHIRLVSPLAVDLCMMPTATIREIRAGKGHKQVSLYAFTCRGYALNNAFLDQVDAPKGRWRDPEAEKKGIHPADR
jgi:hypothetical protein